MVEWKNIGEICYISDYVSNGSFASLRENVQYKNEPDYAILVRVADYSCGFDASKFVYIDEHAYNFLAKSSLDGGEIIMSNVGSCGLLFRCPKLDRKMSLAPNAILIKSDYIDFLYYWLGSNTGQEEIKKITSKSAMPKFNKTEFKKINIPIPSLEEQTRIVGILDTFTSAIDNLKEQIAQRRKQYEYYRDQLLDLEGKPGVEMKTLGEVCEIKGRIGFRGYTREDQVEKGEGAISLSPGNIINGIIDYNSCTYITWEKYEESPEIMTLDGDIILCKTASVGKVAMVMNLPEKATINPQLVVLKNIKIANKYLYYQLSTFKIQAILKGLAGIGSVPNISQAKLADIKICISSSEEQQRIVSILDTFEASIQNLEAQLEQRQKQYEYYRNKLLTFERENEKVS